MSSPPNYEWEQLLDIDDSDLSLTPVLRPYNRHVRETTKTTTTQNHAADNLKEKPVRIIPSHAGIVQVAKLRKQLDIHEGKGGDESVLSTQEYIRKVVDDVGEDEDFKVLYSKRSWRSHSDSERSLSGVGGSVMLMEEEEIVKLMEEEEMGDFELQVCGNIIDQEDLYKFDEEALNLELEEEARQARAEQEWLKKCRQEEELNEEHERQP
uniref:Uncharacterized protein n=1 Tax=Tanacetum cinerariifolium TaxID=118510 RepID=A0A699HSR2_TANCI|nr:hypothetical protein [Tanacetum cinerariifolium]